MPLNKMFGKYCSRCGESRTKNEHEGVPICEKCELEIRAESEAVKPCPACGASMEKVIVLNVIVDRCASCGGAWLDAGELKILREAIENGGSGDLATGLVMGMAID